MTILHATELYAQNWLGRELALCTFHQQKKTLEKEKSYRGRKRRGGNLNVHHEVKGASPQRLRVVRFQLCDTLEIAKP